VSLAEVADRVSVDPRFADLVEDALRIAARSHLAAKRRALGRAVASGALSADEAGIEVSRLIVNVLDGIEAVHVRVLLCDRETSAARVPGAFASTRRR